MNISGNTILKLGYYGTRFRTVANIASRGTAVINNSKRLINAGRAIAGRSTLQLVKGGVAVGKMSKIAAGVIGAVDIIGDLLVDSVIDEGTNVALSLIPGAGLVQLGAATVNSIYSSVTGDDLNLMNAQFIWET